MAKLNTRSYRDRRQYLIAAVNKRRKRIRRMAIEYKGGQCQVCGYNRCIEALEFHHNNSSTKDFSISERGYTRSWEKVKEEYLTGERSPAIWYDKFPIPSGTSVDFCTQQLMVDWESGIPVDPSLRGK